MTAQSMTSAGRAAEPQWEITRRGRAGTVWTFIVTDHARSRVTQVAVRVSGCSLVDETEQLRVVDGVVTLAVRVPDDATVAVSPTVSLAWFDQGGSLHSWSSPLPWS